MVEIFDSLQDRFFGRNVITWLRPIIIIAVLVASAYYGPHASVRLITMIVGAVVLVVLMRWPLVGIFFLVVGSFLVRFDIGTGTQSSINISMILISGLLGLWIIEMLLYQHRVWLFRSQVIPPLFGLAIVSILAFLAGQLPWFAFANQVSIAAQLGGLILFLLSAGAFLWVSQHVNDIKWLRWLVWTFLIVASGYIFARLFGVNPVIRLFERNATGGLFWVWVIALSASQSIFNTQLTRRTRFLLGAVTVATVAVGLINRSWASGWIPGAIALIVIIFLLNWRVGIFVGILLVIAYFIVNPEVAAQDLTNDQYSLFTRQEAWKIVLGEIFRVNPLLGLGPSNYYNYTPLFPILGYNLRFNSHNQYVDILAQTGILGLIMFLWLAFEIGRLAWKLLNRAPPGFARAYVIGVLGGLAGTLVAGMFGDWIIPFVYNVGLGGYRTSVFAWIFLGGLVVIEKSLGEPTKPLQS